MTDEYQEPQQALAMALLDAGVPGSQIDAVTMPAAFALADTLLATMEQDGWRLLKPQHT